LVLSSDKTEVTNQQINSMETVSSTSDISHMLWWFGRVTDYWLKASEKPVRLCCGENLKIFQEFKKKG